MASVEAYRCVYARLIDDRDFQSLPPESQRLWFFLRLSPEAGPVGLFRFYPSTWLERLYPDDPLGSRSVFDDALCQLVRAGYVSHEEGYLLLHRALLFDPHLQPAANENHRKMVFRQLEPMKKLRLAHLLLGEIGLEDPEEWQRTLPPAGVAESHPDPMGNPSECRTEPILMGCGSHPDPILNTPSESRLDPIPDHVIPKHDTDTDTDDDNEQVHPGWGAGRVPEAGAPGGRERG